MTSTVASDDQMISPLGTLPEGWRVKYLRDLTTKIGSGATPRGGQKVYLQRRVRYALIRSQHVFDRFFDENDIAFIADEHANELRNSEVQENDILLNITGDGITFGRSCIVPPSVLPACVNQHVSIVRADPKLCDPRYLVSFLTHPLVKSYIESFNAGGSRRAITKGHIEAFQIPLPSLPIQQEIGSLLQDFDDKIELNRRMNETLEAMARRLFKSWFVDFDPVHAKATLRRQHPKLSNADLSRCALPNMAPEIAELFPDEFEDSTLGPIPKGWRLDEIGNVVSIFGGGTPSTKNAAFWTDGVHPFCTPKDMSSLTSPVVLGTDRQLTDEGLAKVSSGQLPVGTVLLSSRAPIGYLAITEIPVSVNQGIIAMVCDRAVSNLYVLHWARENMDAIIANANGSTFLEISKKNFRPIPALVPESDILEAFNGTAGELHSQCVSNLRESADLVTIRNRLLPRLLSGELSVSAEVA